MSEAREGATVEVCLNGATRALSRGTRIADLVEAAWGRGVAVARNGEVVQHGEWASTRVEPGDEIEIVRPIQGG
jgi:sulfur carrier protein